MRDDINGSLSCQWDLVKKEFSNILVPSNIILYMNFSGSIYYLIYVSIILAVDKVKAE